MLPPDLATVEIPRVLKAFDTLLKPQRQGFTLVHSGVTRNSTPSILYESERCKLRVQVQRDRPYEDIEVYVSYGRLHAPLEKEVIEWNSEKCRCWHRLESSPLLYFLDGVSATEINRDGYRLHPVFEAFRQFSINKGWDGPKYLAARNAFVWKHYGERFFDLFDVRNVDLWKEYRRYLEEHYLDREENYKRKGMVGIPFDPPRYMVC